MPTTGCTSAPKNETRVNFSGRGAATATAGATRPNATPSSPPDSNFRGTNRPRTTGPLFRWRSPGSSARRNSTSVPGAASRMLGASAVCTAPRCERNQRPSCRPSPQTLGVTRSLLLMPLHGRNDAKKACQDRKRRYEADPPRRSARPDQPNCEPSPWSAPLCGCGRRAGVQPTRLKLPTVTWGAGHTLRPGGRQPPWGLTPRSKPRSGTIAAASSGNLSACVESLPRAESAGGVRSVRRPCS